MTPEQRHTSSYRWVLLALIAISSMVAIAMPGMALSVLFDEIKADLGLDLVQIGIIWSVSSLTGMLMAIPGGLLSDRFGPRKMLAIIFAIGGVFSLLRGFTNGFWPFFIASFVFGVLLSTAGLNMIKVVTKWFSPAERGMANGVFSAGFAGGFLIGSFTAATYLSPLLGGWRPVFFMFGGFSMLLGAAWFVLYPTEAAEQTGGKDLSLAASVFDPLRQVVRKPNLWIMGLAKIGFLGCMRGFTGYLPLYLRGQGWEPVQADTAISVFFLFSLIFAIPLPMLSDRYKKRMPFMIVLSAIFGLAVIGVSLTDGWLLIVLVAIAGVTFDAGMGISVTATTEVKGVGAALAGTAVGLVFMIQQAGGTVSPIIGNWLAQFGQQTPFYFWGGMALFGALMFLWFKEEAWEA